MCVCVQVCANVYVVYLCTDWRYIKYLPCLFSYSLVEAGSFTEPTQLTDLVRLAQALVMLSALPALGL